MVLSDRLSFPAHQLFGTRQYIISCIITGPPNGPVLFCLLVSVVVCNAAGGQAGRVDGAHGRLTLTTGQYGYVPLGRHLVIIITRLIMHVKSFTE